MLTPDQLEGLGNVNLTIFKDFYSVNKCGQHCAEDVCRGSLNIYFSDSWIWYRCEAHSERMYKLNEKEIFFLKCIFKI